MSLFDVAEAEPVEVESSVVDIDLANISPCANGCGALVRRFAATPIAGTNKDPITSGPWWCPACLAAKVRAAAEPARTPGSSPGDVGAASNGPVVRDTGADLPQAQDRLVEQLAKGIEELL